MDKTDALIKAYLERSGATLGAGERSGRYPTAEDLSAFIEDRLQGTELERMLAYLRTSPEAQAFIIRLRRMLETHDEAKDQNVPQALIDSAKGLRGAGSGRPQTPPKRPLWLLWMALSVAAFAGSVVVSHYFIQFVAAGVLFGVKAIVDQKAAKTQILIYKALEDAEKSHLHDRSSRL